MDWQAAGLTPGEYVYFHLVDGQLVLSSIQASDPVAGPETGRHYARVRSITKTKLTLDRVQQAK